MFLSSPENDIGALAPSNFLGRSVDYPRILLRKIQGMTRWQLKRIGEVLIMVNILMLLIVFLLSSPAWAEQVEVDVNGMVCAFCATGIERAFSKTPEVADVEVNLDRKKVTIDLKDGRNLEDAFISKVITDNGFGVLGITRNACAAPETEVC